MFKKRLTVIILSILIALLVIGTTTLTIYYNNLPNRISQHETLVFGQNRLAPGSQAAIRVVVRDSKDGSPLEGAKVKVLLKPVGGGGGNIVFSGQTDAFGVSQVTFQVPEDTEGEQTLMIETQSALGTDSLERSVRLERDFRLLLSSDKPIYQPGQVIHLRLLALSTFDLRPASDREVEIIIADGKGNKVLRKKLTTSEFGVASLDFQLASEVNTGAYKVTASMDNTSSEKTVTVEHYMLPKFNLELETDRPFYLPGEHVRGSLKATYFFGKPVSEGQVSIEGYTFDVQHNTVFTLEGATDANGNFEFEFNLPAYIAGSELEGGMGRFYLQASVTDQAQHTEITQLSLPVSQNALVIEAIPEGGNFRMGVENILYVLTSYPDGTPAETRMKIQFYENGQILDVKSGSYGLAEVRLTPASGWQQLMIEARDSQGNFAQKEFYFEGEYSEESVLMRPERPVYLVGETMRLDIFTSHPQGTVYLDIVREGQTVSTRSVEMKDGYAEVAIDLTPDLFGTLELHAYKILRSGNIARDTRLVVVNNVNDVNIAISPDLPGLTLLPGEQTSLNLQVSGQDGNPAQAALGVAIVDEAVFALAEQDPGFAKLYFLLEQELLVPKYDIHGFSVPDLVQGVPVSSQGFVDAIEESAQASLAAATAKKYAPNTSAFSLQANSHEDAMQRAYQKQSQYFDKLSKGLFGIFLAIPLVILGVNISTLQRQKRLGRSLILVAAFLLLISLWLFAWPLGSNYSWARTPLDRLRIFLDWFSWGGQWLALILGIIGLASFLGLAVYAWRKKDPALGWSIGLFVAFFIIAICLFNALSKVNLNVGDMAVVTGLLAFAILPLAFLLRAAGFTWEGKGWAAVATFFVAIFVLIGIVPVMALSQGAMTMQRAAGNLGGVAVEEAMLVAPAMIPSPTEAPMMVEKEAEGESADTSSPTAAAEPPRLRQYFPETMLWLPDVVTDENGRLQLNFSVADNITTWRITALASTQDGRLGSTNAGLRVFQDFFIDLDLPLALTVGDEVSIPVGVFNYLEESQTVRLEVESMDWFNLLDEPIKQIDIAANDISVVYFRIRAEKFGKQPFKVTAFGSKMSDAIQKEVRVFPNGKQISFSHSDRLNTEAPIQESVFIPPEAIPGTQSLLVKIYPGILSQVVEGLDSILRMPFGCFEQTSSTTYPNVLVLDYLKSTNQVSPETQMKAEEYINLGYQRLTTFEVESSGGFSLFGDAPADRMLTAYGLQEFADMSRVYEIDPSLLSRAAEWLFSQQAGDGAWENDRGLVHENTWASLGDDRLPVTAYIAWSLVDAGFANDPRTQSGIAYVRENQAKAEDPYVLALVANALVAADLEDDGIITPATQAVLDRLAGLATPAGSTAYWQSSVATFMGAEGTTGSIETTALAALAFLRSGSHPELGNAALTYLVQQKDSFGTWHSTQATVLALKALIQSVRAGAEKVNASVTITLNGGQTKNLQVTSENFDVVQLVSFDDINPGSENRVEIRVAGEGNLMYQVSGGYYLPWDKLALYPELAGEAELVTIDVAYDRTELSMNDTVEVEVTVTLNQVGGKAESALIDLGLPPGFTVLTEDLAALVTRFDDLPAEYALPTIERFELTGRQILIYISNLSFGNPLTFTYRLQAKFPLVAQTPASNAYDYYNPEVSGLLPPQTLVVNP